MSTTVSNIYYQQQQYIKGYRGDTLEWEVPQSPDYVYIKNLGSGSPNEAIVQKVGTGGIYGFTLEYSYDKTNWTRVVYDTTDQNKCRISVSPGSKLYFRSSDGLNTSDSDYYTFSSGFDTEIGGDLMTIWDYTGNTYLQPYCFYRMCNFGSHPLYASDLKFPNAIPSYGCAKMFERSTWLYSAPDLSVITTSHTYAFEYMFYNCSHLTSIKLPNNQNSLADFCFMNMFSGCTSLVDIIGSFGNYTKVGCYQGMFSGCRSLTTAPALPATTLANYCYQGMFKNCRSLTTAPALPATILAQSCYSDMFSGCSALVNAPSELPATTLVQNCYYYMFYNCVALKESPDMKFTSIATGSLRSMFNGCTLLDKITLHTSTWNTARAADWVNGVQNVSGDFYNLGGATIPTGTNGIPTGWTEHTSL